MSSMKRTLSKLKGFFSRRFKSASRPRANGTPNLSKSVDTSGGEIVMMSVARTASSTYTINSGDTFSSIAAQLGTTVVILEQANPGLEPSNLKVGQIIQLQPAGSSYTIQFGDTLLSIATKNGLTVAALEAANSLVNPTNLIVGSQISIPTNTSVPVTPAPPSNNPAPTTYIIRAGDTFNSIAASLGISVASLEASNPNVNPSILQVGSSINLPATSQPVVPSPALTTSYTIQASDTFSAIATRLGVTVAALEAANPRVNVNNLQVGSQITIPTITQPAPPPQPTGPTPIVTTNGAYIIQAGDTFSSIASKLGTTVQVLETLNPGTNENALQIGAQIFVPSSGQQTSPPVSPPAPTTYTILAGDTFASIAAKVGTTVALLEAANPTIDPTKLQIGSQISLPTAQTNPTPAPAPRTYTVQANDTLSSIAQIFSISLSDLEAANPTVNPNFLSIGQVIILPSKSSSNPTSGTNPGTTVPIPEGGGASVGGLYVNYSGPASAFPDPRLWAPYSYLWTYNYSLMLLHNSPLEISYIKSAIDTVSGESGVDPRIILCIIIQESGGNIRVPNTNNGVENTGLMQAFNGTSFSPSDPAGSILQMIRDGTEGTFYKAGGGPGLVQAFKSSPDKSWYEAVRIYNSGSVNTGDLGNGLGATGSYVRDFANRVMGHVWAGM